MPSLFENTRINTLELKNRFVRSATWEGLADANGGVTDALVDKMVELAAGGVGLIITGHAYVAKEGIAGVRQLGVYRDDLLPGLNRMTDAVHKAGGKIVMQLAHSGIQAPKELAGEEKVFGPSAFEVDPGVFAFEMSLNRIRMAIEDFGNAARRAQQSGFDGVQLHGAHGYLLHQFLSPFFNRRTDDYGGNLQNRCRIVLEICRAVRGQVGDRYPVMIKMNSNDFLEGGITEEDMIASAALLEAAGIDAVELSGGTRYSGSRTPVRMQRREKNEEVYYRPAAAQYKNRIRVPLMLVGGIRSFEVAEDLVKTETADYISLSRPLIREPDLIKRWKSGDTRKACCISDNLCFKPGREGNGVYCMMKRSAEPKFPRRTS